MVVLMRTNLYGFSSSVLVEMAAPGIEIAVFTPQMQIALWDDIGGRWSAPTTLSGRTRMNTETTHSLSQVQRDRLSAILDQYSEQDWLSLEALD